ncbi:MAG: hypothetical protein EOP38_26220 [Rubrivivax sp.]|nr:MAG: hypothetical protein EOP38_26220 [Rubrivivax sp.]
MVMGVPNTETGDTTPQAVWLARCITRLLERDPGQNMATEFARHEAHELWEACGSSLAPETAADRWLGHEEPCELVRKVVDRDRPVEDPLGHDFPTP